MELLQQNISYQVFAIITAVLLLDLLFRLISRRLCTQVKKTKNLWDDALFNSMRRPLSWFIWIMGISYAAELLYLHSHAPILKLNQPIREISNILLMAWFITRLTAFIGSSLIARKKEKSEEVDEATVMAIVKLLRISTVITATLVLLQTLGYSISGVLAFGGIGGIAIGFAAKDLLANFFGGLMIYLDRPFSIGDWVRSPDREIEGTVEHIGWRQTRIRTFNKRSLYIPNSIFATIALENPSRMTHRRIYETIGIRYQDIGKMAVITHEVRRMLEAHPAIDENNTMIVNFNAYGASSLDFFIYTMTHTTVWQTYHEVKQDVLLKVYGVIQRHGADIAFPTTTLDLKGETFVMRPSNPSK